jgi:hypothetical protein
MDFGAEMTANGGAAFGDGAAALDGCTRGDGAAFGDGGAVLDGCTTGDGAAFGAETAPHEGVAFGKGVAGGSGAGSGTGIDMDTRFPWAFSSISVAIRDSARMSSGVRFNSIVSSSSGSASPLASLSNRVPMPSR